MRIIHGAHATDPRRDQRRTLDLLRDGDVLTDKFGTNFRTEIRLRVFSSIVIIWLPTVAAVDSKVTGSAKLVWR